MIGAIQSALSGLLSASKRVEQGAANIAQTSGTAPDQGRLIEDIVDIKTSEISYKANLKTLQVAQDLTKELIESFDKKV